MLLVSNPKSHCWNQCQRAYYLHFLLWVFQFQFLCFFLIYVELVFVHWEREWPTFYYFLICLFHKWFLMTENLLLFTFLSKHSLHTTLCKFNVCNMLAWYICTLKYNCHYSVSQHFYHIIVIFISFPLAF